MRAGWAKERWLELRWGYSNYLSYLVSFWNLTILLSLEFHVEGSQFALLSVSVFVLLSGLGVGLGHFHRKIQQSTDVLVGNEALIEELVRRLKEK